MPKMRLKRYLSSYINLRNQDIFTKRLVLIDNHALLNRVYHINKVDPFFIYTRYLLQIIKMFPSDYMGVVCAEVKRQNCRRVKMYEPYRENKQITDDMMQLIHRTYELFEAVNIKPIIYDTYETNDVVASYTSAASRENIHTTIVTSDKVMFQLINDYISVFSPSSKFESVVTINDATERCGVLTFGQIPDAMALLGDPNDNIPGISGLGPTRVHALLEQFGDIETLIQKNDEIKSKKIRESVLKCKDDLLLWKSLFQLDYNVPLVVPIEDLKRQPMDNEKITNYLSTEGFHALLKQIETNS